MEGSAQGIRPEVWEAVRRRIIDWKSAAVEEAGLRMVLGSCWALDNLHQTSGNIHSSQQKVKVETFGSSSCFGWLLNNNLVI